MSLKELFLNQTLQRKRIYQSEDISIKFSNTGGGGDRTSRKERQLQSYTHKNKRPQQEYSKQKSLRTSPKLMSYQITKAGSSENTKQDECQKNYIPNYIVFKLQKIKGKDIQSQREKKTLQGEVHPNSQKTCKQKK